MVSMPTSGSLTVTPRNRPKPPDARTGADWKGYTSESAATRAPAGAAAAWATSVGVGSGSGVGVAAGAGGDVGCAPVWEPDGVAIAWGAA